MNGYLRSASLAFAAALVACAFFLRQTTKLPSRTLQRQIEHAPPRDSAARASRNAHNGLISDVLQFLGGRSVIFCQSLVQTCQPELKPIDQARAWDAERKCSRRYSRARGEPTEAIISNQKFPRGDCELHRSAAPRQTLPASTKRTFETIIRPFPSRPIAGPIACLCRARKAERLMLTTLNIPDEPSFAIFVGFVPARQSIRASRQTSQVARAKFGRRCRKPFHNDNPFGRNIFHIIYLDILAEQSQFHQQLQWKNAAGLVIRRYSRNAFYHACAGRAPDNSLKIYAVSTSSKPHRFKNRSLARLPIGLKNRGSSKFLLCIGLFFE